MFSRRFSKKMRPSSFTDASWRTPLALWMMICRPSLLAFSAPSRVVDKDGDAWQSL
jgi:hypothetical protein